MNVPLHTLILQWFARRDNATSTAIGAVCAMTVAEIRACLAALKKRRRMAR